MQLLGILGWANKWTIQTVMFPRNFAKGVSCSPYRSIKFFQIIQQGIINAGCKVKYYAFDLKDKASIFVIPQISKVIVFSC